MNLFNMPPADLLSFFLTLFRVSILLFLLPFFGGHSVPKTVKASLCLVMALAVWPHLSFPGEMMPGHPFAIALMMLSEMILGLCIGLIVRILFAAIQTGGQIIGFQMGFAMVNVVDPLTGTSEAVTSHFLYMTSLLTFLALDGHLVLLSALSQSFQMVPPGGLVITPLLAHQILQLSADLFIVAVKVAAPIMAALFLVDLALALVARAAPQMNVLLIGFPLKISVGMFFLGLIFITLSVYMRNYVTEMPETFHTMLKAMQG